MLRKVFPSPIAFDRVEKFVKVPINGTALHAASGGVLGYKFEESSPVLITRAILDITTVSTGACTLDIGYTATSISTTSDTLLDGVDANAAVAVFDSADAGLDSGANDMAQKAGIAKFVTIDEKTGDSTGLVANLYIGYIVV